MFQTLFGPNIIEITNMATGGAQTGMSTTVLQFGLLPNRIVPDIIVWDHGINDAIIPVTTSSTTTTNDSSTTTTIQTPKTVDIVTDQIFQKLQAFYQAVIHLPTNDECSDSTETTIISKPPPPVVILLDTLLGHIEKFPYIVDSLTASAAVSKMLSWYPNTWGISYANTVRSYVFSNLVNRRESLPLLGMKGLYTHPGMMYHITLAWTMTYNIMSALHNSCILQSLSQRATEDWQQPQQRRTIPSTTNGTSLLNHISNTHELDVAYIPELTDDVLMMDIPHQWRQRISESSVHFNKTTMPQKCHSQSPSPPPLQQHARSSLRCYYAWIANRVLRIESPRDIYEVMTENMVQNKGWTSFHEDIKTSPGWVAKKGRNSYFELVFENVPYTVNSLTIIHMQSYSEKWYNSTLQIDSSFEEYDDEHENKESDQVPRDISSHVNSNREIKSPSTTNARQHFVSGYHPEQTSILIPTRIPLLSMSDDMDDINPKFQHHQHQRRRQQQQRLRLHFSLINGETFKIAGMALC
jgi:hypothetical protein